MPHFCFNDMNNALNSACVKRQWGLCLGLISLLCCAQPSAGAREGGSALTFCCGAQNDLYQALGRSRFPRFDSPKLAIEQAAPGSAVLLLADEYPTNTVRLDSAEFAAAEKKGLRLFIEFPGAVPGMETEAPRRTTWERLVVSSARFAPALPQLRILAAHDCHFIPVRSAVGEISASWPEADLVVARVAGYDKAIYGLAKTGVFPIFFKLPGHQLLVATTRLSSFVTGRYAPAHDWVHLWRRVLAELAPGCSITLNPKPVVEAAYGPRARPPRRFQRRAFTEAAHWYTSSHLLVNPREWPALRSALAANAETAPAAAPGAPEGDGSLGILEGFSSAILYDGSQPRRLPLRADCNAESAMVLALDGRLERSKRNRLIASNLLDFVYVTSGLCQGARGDPQQAAFGLIGWGDIASAWLVANYGDDNARAMLATAVAGAALRTERWDPYLACALLANFRTTGRLGFRTDRIDLPDLKKNGWQHYYQGAPINYAPHFESYLWACYLWAYAHTGFQPFLERTRTAIGMTMKAYPEQWGWQNNVERARMLLCLAWLVRVEDTAERRDWLHRVAADLLADQKPSGAIYERLGRAQGGFFQPPQRNEDYGTTETPLLQENGDPVSDQLYTTGFALLGLHEAAGATGDPKLKQAEDRLAEYLCRIQTRSRKFPYLNGTWFRAFDDQRWEAWASSADTGWGAWSIESGWGQAWTAAVLALRELHTTFWDFTAGSRVAESFDGLRKQMLSGG